MLAHLPSPAVPPAAVTILVVDDVADARDMMARLLRLDGCKSVTAAKGRRRWRPSKRTTPT